MKGTSINLKLDKFIIKRSIKIKSNFSLVINKNKKIRENLDILKSNNFSIRILMILMAINIIKEDLNLQKQTIFVIKYKMKIKV